SVLQGRWPQVNVFAEDTVFIRDTTIDVLCCQGCKRRVEMTLLFFVFLRVPSCSFVESCRSVGRRRFCRRYYGKGAAAEHDAGLHFNRLSIPQAWPEPPLLQGVGDGFGLLGEGADKVDVFYLALFIDDDADWNGIRSALGKDRLNLLNHVFFTGVVLYAHRDSA